MLFDVRLAGQSLTYRARLLKKKNATDVFALIAWAHRRRFPHLEEEFRRAMDSFRFLPG